MTSEPKLSSSPAPSPDVAGESGASEASGEVSEKAPAADSAADSGEPSTSTVVDSGSSSNPSKDWQAVWSAAHGAYYFYNSVTKETTWTNPLVPPSAEDVPEATPAATALSLSSEPSSSTAPVTVEPSQHPLPASNAPTAEQYGGIDPELAYLDPSLAYLASTDKAKGPVPTFTAKFGARSGRFAGADARDPSHISEYERAKRMSEAYFDVDQWKAELEERENARKRAAEEDPDGTRQKKRPTKADLNRFKEAKMEKKKRKNAWLRE